MSVRDYEKRFEWMIPLAKKATMAYQNAARYFDEMKEILLVDLGLVHTSELFHETAHWFPGQFDVIGDILHQHHVIQSYGGTPEFPGVDRDVGDICEMAVRLLDDIIDSLSEFIRISDGNSCWAIGRELETLQINVSEVKDKYLKVWAMYDFAETSATSFDSWVLHLKGGC